LSKNFNQKVKNKQKILLKNPIPFVLKIDLLKLEEGRQVMFLPGIDVPMTIVKTDGSFTYDTSDMATIKQRLYEENADWVIYVIDSGQVMDFIKRIYRIFI
jgi:arginyl-tRNA synthetase